VVEMRYHVGGILSSILMFGALIYLSVGDKTDTPRRLVVLTAFGFFQGVSVGPLINYSIAVDPSLVVTAFLGTAAVFACFTFSALTAKSYSYLALRGFLSTGLSGLLLLGVIGWFFPSVAMFRFSLYLGLVVFCGYVLYDTQLIVLRYQTGDRDFILHAMELFIDFVAIFVRILVILLDNADSKKKRKSERN